MKRLHAVLLTVGLWFGAVGAAATADQVEGGDMTLQFRTPPDAARPWVYWFWLNGNITREGITADLEAMKRVGIGGVLIMEVDQGAPLGPVAFMGPQWRDLFQHAAAESRRLGLEVNMTNDAGWNGSGGPWIKPEQSMQRVVWSETRLEGGRRFEGILPLPPDNAVFYRDIAVLALPTPRSELTKMADASPRFTASSHSGEVHLPVVLPVPEPGKPQYVQVEFPQPFTASTLEISQPNLHGLYGTALKVQISNDGREFTTVGDSATYHFPQIAQFNTASARYYRVLFTVSNKVKNVVVDGLELHNHYRIGDIESKTAVQPAFLPPDAAQPNLPAEFATSQDRIVDLTTKMNKDGRLVWDCAARTMDRAAIRPHNHRRHESSGPGVRLRTRMRQA